MRATYYTTKGGSDGSHSYRARLLRLAQEDLVRASRLVATRIELACQYGATEDDITHTLRTEGG